MSKKCCQQNELFALLNGLCCTVVKICRYWQNWIKICLIKFDIFFWANQNFNNFRWQSKCLNFPTVSTPYDMRIISLFVSCTFLCAAHFRFQLAPEIAPSDSDDAGTVHVSTWHWFVYALSVRPTALESRLGLDTLKLGYSLAWNGFL